MVLSLKLQPQKTALQQPYNLLDETQSEYYCNNLLNLFTHKQRSPLIFSILHIGKTI